MSRNSLFIVAIIVLVVIVAAVVWSPVGRNMLGGSYGAGGTPTVKTP